MKSTSIFSLTPTVLVFAFSLSHIEPTQASQTDIDACKASVRWNNNKNQVKDGDRREYLGCLAVKLTNSSSPVDLLNKATITPTNPVGCFPLAFISHSAKAGRANAFAATLGKGNVVSASDWGTLPRDSHRRWTIACLQASLAQKSMFAEEAACRSKVRWNKRKNQVKDGNRRKYLGCLAEKLTNTAMPADLMGQATQARSNNMEGCFPPVKRYQMHVSTDWGSVPQDQERRNTIACLEDALR